MSKYRFLFIFLVLLATLLVGCASPSDNSTSNDNGISDNGGTMKFTQPPQMIIDVNKIYTATITTEKGDIIVELYPAKAPKTVNNFVFLSREGFYNGTTFHRVIPGFMAQGGDPTGTGTGGPGYKFEDEFSDLKHVTGVISMANSGANTNGSQFFITYAPAHYLDGKHTVFGKVIKGMDILNRLTPRDPSKGPTTPGDKIISITIAEGA